MIPSDKLHRAFGAWYDHKMDPGNAELLRVHHATLDELAQVVLAQTGQHVSGLDMKQALGEAFGQWMRREGLPKPSPKP